VDPEKTTKKKRRAPRPDPDATFLRLRTDPREERRFEPKASAGAIGAILGMSIGAVLVGAGTYGQWFRDSFHTGEPLGPHKYSAYLLAAGAVALLAVAIFGGRVTKPLRVGDAGIAIEKEGTEIERLPWFEVTSVLVDKNAVTVQGSGSRLTISTRFHGEAAARILAEARRRIPKRVEEHDRDILPRPAPNAGELLPLEAPQLAGTHCAHTDKLIAFERDARLCGRCGEVYHRDGVPPECVGCGAKLTKAKAAEVPADAAPSEKA
jgi:hypothetical protein